MDIFWRENKPFLLGVAGAFLVGLLCYFFFVSPARETARQSREELKKVQVRFTGLLETRGQLTDDVIGRAKEDLERIEKEVQSTGADLGLVLPREFSIPKGERNQSFFFDTQYNRVKRDLRNLAPKKGREGIRLVDDKLGFNQAPAGPKSVPEYLARLALVTRLILAAFDAPVAEVTSLQALPGLAVNSDDPGPSPALFIQRHTVEMQVKTSYPSFLRILHGLCQKGGFLAVERMKFTKDGYQNPLGTAEFSVSGLTFNLGGALLGSTPATESTDAGGRKTYRRR
jgi:hypothetical protein